MELKIRRIRRLRKNKDEWAACVVFTIIYNAVGMKLLNTLPVVSAFFCNKFAFASTQNSMQ